MPKMFQSPNGSPSVFIFLIVTYSSWFLHAMNHLYFFHTLCKDKKTFSLVMDLGKQMKLVLNVVARRGIFCCMRSVWKEWILE